MVNTTEFLAAQVLWLVVFPLALALPGAEAAQSQFRFVRFGGPYERTYGGYWWIEPDGVMCEEGITVEGSPLVCSSQTMLVANAATAEVCDLHFLDGDIRRTWVHSGGRGRNTAVHLFTKLCPDPLVGSWGSYLPALFRYKPGVLYEDIRRPARAETFGATHRVGALEYRTLRERASPVEVRQRWYVPGKWCVACEVEIANLAPETDEAATLAVAMNLRSTVTANRKRLDWYADFHSGGKAGVGRVPRLSDEEYRRLMKLRQFQVEYREPDRCVVARRGWDVRAERPSHYFCCLMLDAPVRAHVLSASGNAQQSALFAKDKTYPRALTAAAAVVGLCSQPFRLAPDRPHRLRYAIAFGKTADEAIANARNGLEIGAGDAARKLDEYWSARLPALTTGDPTLTAMVRYALITQDVNWEPDGRVAGDLGGWGRCDRAEVCGYKNYYDQADTVVPILDVPVYDPRLFKKGLLYDVDPRSGRLRKLIVWRQQYDSMLYWPAAVYKVWMASGDEEFLRRIYPALDRTFRWLRETRATPDGLLRMLTMPYDIFTVGLGDDRPVMTKAQAVAAQSLGAMVRMARHLQKAPDAAFYEQWLAQIKRAANQKLWHKTFYSFSLDFPDRLCLSGNACAITAGLASPEQTAAIIRQIEALYTGSGFPNVHPPLPAWVGSRPYDYQNGDMYIDQLALIARAANKARSPELLSRVLFEFRRLVQRHKCFPVTGHPWDANRRGGVNEVHSASALVAVLTYGVVGLEEGEELRFRPLMVPEVAGCVEMRGLRWRATLFDIRLEGLGDKVRSVELDGRQIPEPLIPAPCYDGRRHTLVIRVEPRHEALEPPGGRARP